MSKINPFARVAKYLNFQSFLLNRNMKTSAKFRTFDVFGVPGAFPGEALGRILGNKFRGEKIDEKKSGRRLPRRVTRTPDKTLPRGFLSMVRHAFAPPGASGRADCLRFASPAEATWRLGGCEVGDMQDQSHST